MYKRKIESLLQEWKSQPKRKPLIIKGVRQCGKTSSVQEFAQNNYLIPFYMAFLLTEMYIKKTALHVRALSVFYTIAVVMSSASARLSF